MSNRPLLIVDDEPANLAILDQILGDEYRLVSARNGATALSAAHKHRPALILLDVNMPDMDGYTVCRKLKSHPDTETIPIIFVTGSGEIGDETAGFEAGGVDYIVKPASPSIVRARIRTHLSLTRATKLERSYREAVYMLGEAGHYNDTDTGVHIWRMAAYAKALAAARGWDGEACSLLELAAPMHDTGKLCIPDSILRKPGKLDADEWTVMRTHPRIGYEILSKSDAPLFQLAAEIALHHHEKWDGSGYPDALESASISEAARIVAVADVFDALTMKRPYKEPWPIERVTDTLREGAGSHFDPQLVDIFVDIMPQILDIKSNWDAREAGNLH